MRTHELLCENVRKFTCPGKNGVYEETWLTDEHWIHLEHLGPLWTHTLWEWSNQSTDERAYLQNKSYGRHHKISIFGQTMVKSGGFRGPLILTIIFMIHSSLTV